MFLLRWKWSACHVGVEAIALNWFTIGIVEFVLLPNPFVRQNIKYFMLYSQYFMQIVPELGVKFINSLHFFFFFIGSNFLDFVSKNAFWMRIHWAHNFLSIRNDTIKYVHSAVQSRLAWYHAVPDHGCDKSNAATANADAYFACWWSHQRFISHGSSIKTKVFKSKLFDVKERAPFSARWNAFKSKSGSQNANRTDAPSTWHSIET